MDQKELFKWPDTTADPQEIAGSADIWGYLAFSHGWTWLFWSIVIIRNVDVWNSSLSVVLFAIGGLGVPLGGIVMSWKVAGRDGLRDLGKRIIDPKRISGWWWVAILFLYPAMKLTAGGLAWLLGEASTSFNLEEAAGLIAQPGNLLLFAAFILLLGPLPEEIGWRGYLLDRLQLRMTPLGASIVIGLLWFAWHIPLFFMPGYFERAGGAPEPFQMSVGILLGSILYTWLYNNTGRSVLAAILFHFAGNFSGEMLDATDSVYQFETYITMVVVLLVLWVWNTNKFENTFFPEATDIIPAEDKTSPQSKNENII